MSETNKFALRDSISTECKEQAHYYGKLKACHRYTGEIFHNAIGAYALWFAMALWMVFIFVKDFVL